MAIMEREIGIEQIDILPAKIPVIDPEDKARINATRVAYKIREQSGNSMLSERMFQSFLRTAWGGPEKRRIGYRYADHY